MWVLGTATIELLAWCRTDVQVGRGRTAAHYCSSSSSSIEWAWSVCTFGSINLLRGLHERMKGCQSASEPRGFGGSGVTLMNGEDVQYHYLSTQDAWERPCEIAAARSQRQTPRFPVLVLDPIGKEIDVLALGHVGSMLFAVANTLFFDELGIVPVSIRSALQYRAVALPDE